MKYEKMSNLFCPITKQGREKLFKIYFDSIVQQRTYSFFSQCLAGKLVNYLMNYVVRVCFILS